MVNKLDLDLARKLAEEYALPGEEKTIDSFLKICEFLEENPDRLSINPTRAEKSKGIKPSIDNPETLEKMVSRHFLGFRKVDIPKEPSTVPDPAVSKILQSTYGYSEEEASKIKLEHQQSMLAENAVGGLLERYIDSKLNDEWYWCCGDFVRAIDFVSKESGKWKAYQIKNRDNTENSSSSAIRNGTTIDKWFRSYSKDTTKARELGHVNWDNLPEELKNKGLSESDFLEFIDDYVKNHKE